MPFEKKDGNLIFTPSFRTNLIIIVVLGIFSVSGVLVIILAMIPNFSHALIVRPIGAILGLISVSIIILGFIVYFIKYSFKNLYVFGTGKVYTTIFTKEGIDFQQKGVSIEFIPWDHIQSVSLNPGLPWTNIRRVSLKSKSYDKSKTIIFFKNASKKPKNIDLDIYGIKTDDMVYAIRNYVRSHI